MSIRFSPFAKWPCLLLALGLFLGDSSPSYGQHGHIFLRGTPGVGMAPTGFPGAMPMALANNGSLQVSINPNVGVPNTQPFAYIASLPMGDRLPYNGIFADPQMFPQTQYGQVFSQNLLQLQQQQLFGNPLGPVGNLLALGLINQPFAPGTPQVPPLGKGGPGFVGWGAARPNYSPYLNNPYLGLGVGLGMGYNPYMGMGYNPMSQGMTYDPSMGQGTMFNPYMMMGMMGMMNGMYGTAGYNPALTQNGGNLLVQPNQPGNLPNSNVNLNGFGKGFGGF